VLTLKVKYGEAWDTKKKKALNKTKKRAATEANGEFVSQGKGALGGKKRGEKTENRKKGPNDRHWEAI